MRNVAKLLYALGIAAGCYFLSTTFGARKATPARESAADSSEVVRAVDPAILTAVPQTQPIANTETQEPAVAAVKKSAEHSISAQPRDITALSTTLEAEYATDALPTRDSYDREKTVGKLFADDGVGGKAQLQELNCREKICRGVVRLAHASDDNEVFNRTFLSAEFARSVPDAISVISRQKMPDGSVLATFFIHPQSSFEATSGDE